MNNVEEKNRLVLEYISIIEEKFKSLGHPISAEMVYTVREQYANSTKSFEEIKEEIDKLVDVKLNGIREAKLQSENFKQTNYHNAELDERESRTFEQIKYTYDKVQKLLHEAGVKVYISGGTVPYLLLNQDSNRLHDDIDTVCKMEDINTLREVFQIAGLYNQEWDSTNFAQDGKDYGFEMKIDGVPFGIYPFTYENGMLTQYSYDPYNQHCKIKKMPLESVDDYVTSYESADGKVYDTMSLEVIKLTKDSVNRAKDIADSKKISEIGVREDVFNRMQMPVQIQDKLASELESYEAHIEY